MAEIKKLINIRYEIGANRLTVKHYEGIKEGRFGQSRWMNNADANEENKELLCLCNQVNKIRSYRNIEYSAWTDFPLEKALKIFKQRVTILIKSAADRMEVQINNFLENVKNEQN